MSFALLLLSVLFQGGVGEPPAASAVPVLRLKSGAELMTRALPGAKGMGVFLFMRCGFGMDPKGKEGLAHYVEHLSMTGIGRGHKQGWTIQEWFRKRPMGTNAMTREGWTVYFSIGERGDALKDLGFFAQIAMGGVGFSQEAMQRERGRVLQEIDNMTSRMPGGVLIWKQHTLRDPLHRVGIGRMDDVRRMELKDCEAFRDRFYRAENALFVLVGDVKVGEDRALLEGLLGKGDSGAARVPPSTPRPSSKPSSKLSSKPLSFVGKHPQIGAPFLSLAFRAPDPKSPEAPVFTLAAFYLMRKAMASFRPRGRELQGFFQPAQFPFMEDPSLFFLNRRAKDGESLEALRAEVRDWLAARKKDLINKSTLSFLLHGMDMFFWPEPIPSGKRRFLMRNPRGLYSLGLSTGTFRLHGYPEDFLARMKKVKPEELKTAITRGFSYERAVQAALLPGKQGK